MNENLVYDIEWAGESSTAAIEQQSHQMSNPVAVQLTFCIKFRSRWIVGVASPSHRRRRRRQSSPSSSSSIPMSMCLCNVRRICI